MNRDARGELESALERWGRSLDLPRPPDLAAQVRKALESEQVSSRRRRLPFRFGIPALGLTAAVAVVLTVLVGRPGWSLPHRPEGLPSGQSILTDASTRFAAGRRIVHLTYRLTPARRGYHSLDIWERAAQGRILTLELYGGNTQRLALAYVQQAGMVRRTGSSPKNLPTKTIERFIQTLPVHEDGRLAATITLNAKLSKQVRIVRVWRTQIGIHKALAVAVRNSKSGSRTVFYYDSRTYTLLEAKGAGHLERLTKAEVLPRRSTPQLIVTDFKKYRQEHSTPTAY